MASTFTILQEGKVTYFDLSFLYGSQGSGTLSVYPGVGDGRASVSDDGKTITWKLPNNKTDIYVTNYISTNQWDVEGNRYAFDIQSATSNLVLKRSSYCNIDIMTNEVVSVSEFKYNYSASFTFNVYNGNGERVTIHLDIG